MDTNVLGSDRTLHPLALLRRTPQNTYELVMRWIIGGRNGENDLPHPGDSFEVVITIRRNGATIRPDGTIDPAGARHPIEVRPRLRAMIDPPRRTVNVPNAPPRRIAERPTHPVNCALNIDSELPAGEGFGVCHLLGETHPARVAWRASRVLEKGLAEASRSLRAEGVGLAAFDDSSLRALARSLAQALARGRLRADTIPTMMAQQVQHLARMQMEIGFKALEGATHPWTLFGAQHTGSARWQLAALLTRTFTNPAVMAEVEGAVVPPTSTREQLRLRALQGGTLVDFWCPDGAQPANCADDDRGRHFPASELIGTGLTFGAFTREQVESWIEGVDPGDVDAVTIEVHHRPGARAPAANDEALGDVPRDLFTADDQAFEPGSYPISARAVRRALDTGTGTPITRPRRVSINYDLIQSNAGEIAEEPKGLAKTVTHPTGDGRVEILIEGAPSLTVFGFNVYGMWNMDATRPFFDNPQLQPTLAQLQPWLISRRYSYALDLAGAFPTPNGMHDALRRALDAPPWEPVLVHPEKITDEAPDKPANLAKELPLNDRGASAVWGIDLRNGMRSDLDAPPPHRPHVRWDPRAPTHVAWTVEQDRSGAPVASPQAYRFWVTAVDCFEQESEPVPVTANDSDAGQSAASFIFVPRRRAPLLPPPGVQGGDPTVEYTAANGQLTVKWGTPFLNEVGRKTGDELGHTPQRARKADVVCNVLLFRRPLRKRVDAEVHLFGTRQYPPPLDLPQWVRAIDALDKDGWSIAKDVVTVQPPAGNEEAWSATYNLAHGERGFEYLAAIVASIKPDRRVFWAPDAIAAGGKGRRVSVLGTDGKFKFEIISETPTTSDVSHSRPLAVPNLEAARGPKLVSERLLRAKPVLPPPGILRDAVLMKLLDREVEGDPSPLPPWADTGVRLTSGRATTLRTALARVDGLANILASDVGDLAAVETSPLLADARLLLAADFKNETDRPSADDQRRQHASIGFRGLEDVTIEYTPFAAGDAVATDEAEAVRLRVFGVRVPVDAESAKAYASARFTATRIAGRDSYRVEYDEARYGEVVTAVRVHGQPALVRLDVEGRTPVFATVEAVRATSPGRAEIDLHLQDTAQLPNEASLSLFVAQPLVEREIRDLKAVSQHRFLLPIGGGYKEVFCWWFCGVSAQERLSGNSWGRTPRVFRELKSSVQPPVPRQFEIYPPWEDDHALVPVANFRAWLPSDVNGDTAARSLPRLLVTWAPIDDDDAGIAIERNEYAVGTGRGRMKIFASEWAAIRAVDELADGKRIPSGVVPLLAQKWLLGQIVDIDGPAPEPDYHIPPARRVPRDGLLQVNVPGSTAAVAAAQRAAFIDYYRRRGNPNDAMDGQFAYEYRIRSVVDLGPEYPWRYLMSAPTAWSERAIPQTRPITVRNAGRKDLDVRRATPRVRFELRTTETKHQDQEAALAAITYEYRVQARRRLDFTLRSDPNATSQPAWRLVGEPVRLRPGQTVMITDDALDRTGPETPLELLYELVVNQFALSGNEEWSLRQQKADGGGSLHAERITLRKPASIEQEVDCVVALEVR